jgi:AraC-like DNA-binding protein
MDRFALGAGIDGYVCRFSRTRGHRIATVLRDYELGACLTGTYAIRPAGASARVYTAGQTYQLDAATPTDSGYRADDAEGRVVMFTLSPELVPGALADPDRELRLVRFESRDAELLDLAHAAYDARRRGLDLTAAIRRSLVAWVASHSDLSAPDPVILARREIERYWRQDLYLAHLAQGVGLQPVTFLRRFQLRYGITPVQYRIKLRLNEAARLAWLQPRRPLKEIALECGFEHEGYFHRAYRRYFGNTPGKHRAS